MNIDWSKAPEGATHKDPDTDCFYKLVKDVWHLICGDGESVVSASIYNGETKPSDLIERPKKQGVWDGVGLPPVNCFCETLDEDADCWVKVEIYAHTEFMGEAHACAKNVTDMFYGLAHEFRAIKTPEQLAAEERERTRKIGVAQMMEHIHFSLPKELWGECEPACYALYDAGFKIQKYSSEERGREIIKMAAIVAHLFKEEKEPEYPALEKILGELYDAGYKLAK